MTKSSYKLFFLFWALLPGLLFSKEGDGGYLGVSIEAQWLHYQSPKATEDIFKLPISFVGAARNFEIITSLFIFPEVTRIDQYYTGDSRKLNPGAIVPFSFANFDVQYKIARWKIFHFNGGIKMGHYGYLAADWKDPAYVLFIAPKGSIYAFIGRHLMIKVPVEIPVALYHHYLKQYFSIKTGLEVTLDPVGPILEPANSTAFYSVGVEYSYLYLETDGRSLRTINYLQPYFRLTILY